MRRTGIGGETPASPLRRPFRFHARRFPNYSALRPLPQRALRFLTCGPGWGDQGSPRALPRGPTGRRVGTVRRWLGPERGGGARPPGGPGARHPTFIGGRSRTQPRRRRASGRPQCAAHARPRPLARGLAHRARTTRIPGPGCGSVYGRRGGPGFLARRTTFSQAPPGGPRPPGMWSPRPGNKPGVGSFNVYPRAGLRIAAILPPSLPSAGVTGPPGRKLQS